MSDMSPEDREYINTCTNAIILICDMIETFTMDFNQVLKKYHPDYRLEMYDKIMQVGKEAKAHVKFMSECTDNVYGGFPLHVLTVNEEDGYNCEVCGNIYDNSELLKGGK